MYSSDYRFLHRLLLAIALICLVSGCNKEERPGEIYYSVQGNPFEQDPEDRERVLSLLTKLDQGPIQEAYRNLIRTDYTRYQRTEQFDDTNYLVAFRERVTRHEGVAPDRSFRQLDSDSTGEFDFGFFKSFVSVNTQSQDPRDLTPFVLPEDPTYLSPRHLESYLFRFRSDTLMWNRRASVIEIRALPEKGDGLNIRRVRMYVDSQENILMGVHLERIDLALLFREESSYFVHIQPATDDKWVPHNTRFQTRIIMPFKPPQLYRTVSTYYNIAPQTELDAEGSSTD